MSITNLTFEQALEELQEIIKKIEKGELKLDEALEQFQRGIELYKFCNNTLNEAEGKIKIILQEKNNIVEEDFIDKA